MYFIFGRWKICRVIVVSKMKKKTKDEEVEDTEEEEDKLRMQSAIKH